MRIQDLVLNFISNHKSYMGLYIFFSCATPIVNVLLPKYYGELLNDIKKKENRQFLKNVGLILFLWILAQVFYSIMDKMDKIILPKLQSYVRYEFISYILEQSNYSYNEIETGDIISKILKLPTILKELFHQTRYVFFPTFMTVLFSIVYFTYLNPKLGIVALFSISVFVTYLYNYMQNSLISSQETDSKHNRLHEEIDDILTNIFAICSSGNTRQELERIKQYQYEYDVQYKDTLDRSSKVKRRFNLSYVLILTVIFGYAFYLQIKDELQPEQLISVLFVLIYLINQLANTSGEVRDLIFNIGIIQKINNYLNTLSTTHKQNDKKINITEGNIYFNNVTMKYNNTTHYIFKNFSYSFPSHKKTGIEGSIGTGKSTLIKLLLGLYSIEQGDIQIDGQSIQDIDIDYYRKHIGFIPQTTQLFNRTILDNILYGTQSNKEEVIQLLNTLKLSQITPDILHKSCGKHGSKLSGGQRQIILLLRCILKQTSIIIMDEPTASLDYYSKQDLLRILHTLNNTMLIVTHDPELLSHCDVVINSSQFIQP